MKILHTEASPGWGGQELRILREAEGMRSRGHDVILIVQKGGGLVLPARKAGFTVYEASFKKMSALSLLFFIVRIILRHHIDIVNTHSSLDAWIGGLAARLTRRKVIRTRHLSTPIRKGFNSRLLYNTLADVVVTTCEAVVPLIRCQAHLPQTRCLSIPTGVDPSAIICSKEEVEAFRKRWNISSEEILVGTLCVLRGWKGVSDLLKAASLLREVPHLKWIVVGGGVSEAYFHEEWKKLHLEQNVIFTGHLSPPYAALAAMDIFLLLSWANEGVSQASLQAAWLQKPLITTPIGGLPEVCLPGKTGIQVNPHAPNEVAEAVKSLLQDPVKRGMMGKEARKLVEQKFTLAHTLDAMEKVYLQNP